MIHYLSSFCQDGLVKVSLCSEALKFEVVSSTVTWRILRGGGHGDQLTGGRREPT